MYGNGLCSRWIKHGRKPQTPSVGTPPDDRQGLPPTSCTRTTKPKHLKQARKVQPILQVVPQSILKSATHGSPQRRSVYFALSHNTVNGVPATIPPRDKVSRRSLIYNSSLTTVPTVWFKLYRTQLSSQTSSLISHLKQCAY